VIPTLQQGQFGRRIVGGTGIAADPSFASVKLLMHFDAGNGSTTITDSSGSPATCTATNGAACSTTRTKYGASVLFLDGTNDYVATTRGTNIGTGAFTLEAWCRWTGAQAGRVISIKATPSVNAVQVLGVTASGQVELWGRNSSGTGTFDFISAASVVTMNDTAWHHIAGTRDASANCTVWVDGLSVATGTSSTSPNGSSRGYDIGSQYGLAEFFKGYIDDVRITEGVCRYTGTFTPPTAAFPNS
jgi:hypothetical protein